MQFAADGIAEKIAVVVLFIIGKDICAIEQFAACLPIENTGIKPRRIFFCRIAAKLPAKGILFTFGKSADEVYADICLSAAQAGLQINANLFYGGKVFGNGVFRPRRERVVNVRQKPRLLLFAEVAKAAAAFRRVGNGSLRKLLRRCFVGKSQSAKAAN